MPFSLAACAKANPKRETIDGRWALHQIPRAGSLHCGLHVGRASSKHVWQHIGAQCMELWVDLIPFQETCISKLRAPVPKATCSACRYERENAKFR